MEPTTQSPLTPHLLIEDPEDERGIDHDFFTEVIARFSEDDSIQGALVGAVEDLSQDLARMNMNSDYKPYIMVSVMDKHGSQISVTNQVEGTTKFSPIPCYDQRHCPVANIPTISYCCFRP